MTALASYILPAGTWTGHEYDFEIEVLAPSENVWPSPKESSTLTLLSARHGNPALKAVPTFVEKLRLVEVECVWPSDLENDIVIDCCTSEFWLFKICEAHTIGFTDPSWAWSVLNVILLILGSQAMAAALLSNDFLSFEASSVLPTDSFAACQQAELAMLRISSAKFGVSLPEFFIFGPIWSHSFSSFSASSAYPYLELAVCQALRMT